MVPTQSACNSSSFTDASLSLHWSFPLRLTTSVEVKLWFVHCYLGEGREAGQEEEGTSFVL